MAEAASGDAAIRQAAAKPKLVKLLSKAAGKAAAAEAAAGPQTVALRRVKPKGKGKAKPPGAGWDRKGERQRDTSATQGNFRSDALARAGFAPGLAVSRSEPVAHKASTRASSKSAVSKVDSLLHSTSRTVYPSSKREYDQYVTAYAHKQREVDEMEEAEKKERRRASKSAGSSADPAAGAPEGLSEREWSERDESHVAQKIPQAATAEGAGPTASSQRSIGAAAESKENIAPSEEEELESIRAANQAYYKQNPECVATTTAISLPTIKIKDRLELLKDTLRPGQSKKFEIVANAFFLLHHKDATKLASPQFEHDQLCVYCANALQDVHVSELGPLLRILTLLAKNNVNKKILLRYGVVGTALKRLSRSPAEKRPRTGCMKMLCSVMFA